MLQAGIYATHIGVDIRRNVSRITKCAAIRIAVAKLCKIALLLLDDLVRHTKVYRIFVWYDTESNQAKVNVATGTQP